MTTHTVGIIINGATSRIASTQHLQSSLVPIRAEGGLPAGEDRIMPRLLLVGRNADRLAATARQHGLTEWSTDIDAALANPEYSVFFDAAATHLRLPMLHRAVEAGKHIYTEKPVAPSVEEGLALVAAAEKRGLKHGAVEDKVFLPGFQKVAHLNKLGFFGRVVSFRLEFGWWVFDGHDTLPQRPSWNYQKAGGGGLALDMYPHWRYVVEGLVGRIKRVVASTYTAIPDRIDEQGQPYKVDVDDSVTAMVELEGGAFGTICSSWAARARNEDLVILHVDGTKGSARAGLHRCHIQSYEQTPRLTGWNVNTDLNNDYSASWGLAADLGPYKNPYRYGWEAFLRHIALGTPIVSDLRAGVRDVQFAEACYRSSQEARWVSMA